MIETLLQKQARFGLAVGGLIAQANKLGYVVTLGEAWRSPEQALQNAKDGKGIVHSLHTQRLAIDLDLFTLIDGQYHYITDSTGHTELGKWWCAQSPDYRWGGNFTTLKDFDHYSLTPDGGKTQ